MDTHGGIDAFFILSKMHISFSFLYLSISVGVCAVICHDLHKKQYSWLMFSGQHMIVIEYDSIRRFIHFIDLFYLSDAINILYITRSLVMSMLPKSTLHRSVAL